MTKSKLPALFRQRADAQGVLWALRLLIEEDRARGWETEDNEAAAQLLSDSIGAITAEFERLTPDPVRPDKRSTRT